MIRFLDLTDDIWGDEEERTFEFAWYDTVTGKILSFNNETVWSSWEDFESDFNADDGDRFQDAERFSNLYREKAF